MVYIVTCYDEICFVADNEHDVVKYLLYTPQSGFTDKIIETDIYAWLDEGHVVDELTEFLDNGFQVDHYCLGYDYRHDSPYFLKEIK